MRAPHEILGRVAHESLPGLRETLDLGGGLTGEIRTLEAEGASACTRSGARPPGGGRLYWP